MTSVTIILFEITLRQTSDFFCKDQKTLMSSGDQDKKHASNSPVTFATLKRFAVLFFLQFCCINSQQTTKERQWRTVGVQFREVSVLQRVKGKDSRKTGTNSRCLSWERLSNGRAHPNRSRNIKAKGTVRSNGVTATRTSLKK